VGAHQTSPHFSTIEHAQHGICWANSEPETSPLSVYWFSIMKISAGVISYFSARVF
jgi:hypothetical protein